MNMSYPFSKVNQEGKIMKLFSRTKSSLLPGRMSFDWIKRAEERLKRRRIRRKAEKNRHELRKLGHYLLQDLGFDSRGCLLKPNQDE
jgi:hypothetical protein